LIRRRDNNHDKLETRIMFDRSRASLPTVFIALPSEGRGGSNSIGIGRDDHNTIKGADGRLYNQYSRSFKATYELGITGKDPIQTVVIFNILKAGLISIMDSIERSGLRIAELSGGDVRIDQELIPHGYIRSLYLKVDYEYDVPTFFSLPDIDTINFDNAVPK